MSYFLLMSKTIPTWILLITLLSGCSSESSKNKMPAMFNTQEEAEQAAKNFNCIGAHKMGDKWMPCKSHQAHEDHKQKSDHGHNHHNN